jgi:hypothetical protein
MMRALAVLALALLSGCMSQMDAGIAHYTIRPFTDPATGKSVCCEAEVVNGKNIAAVQVHVTRTSDNAVTIDLSERAVDGSTGQAISSQTTSDVAGAVSNAAASAVSIIPK